MDVEEGYPKSFNDPEPDLKLEKCELVEDFNEMGPGMCSDSNQCRGERVCDEFYYCIGYSNCKDDEEEEIENKCEIDETDFPIGPHLCKLSHHC